MAGLLDGYRDYAAETLLLDAEAFGQAYVEYLKSEEGRKRLYDNLGEVIDMDEAAAGLSGIFQEEGVEISSEVEKQISTAMEGMMSQLGGNIAGAMRQAVGQIGTSMANAIQQALGQMSSPIHGKCRQY